jgi:hypothetical protein
VSRSPPTTRKCGLCSPGWENGEAATNKIFRKRRVVPTSVAVIGYKGPH